MKTSKFNKDGHFLLPSDKKRKLYLVFKIFKNCKISENWINLSALRNLKPVRKRGERLSKINHFRHVSVQPATRCSPK